ncbi:MAG: hypothetical protein GY859_37905 [Desulfobacterales bacterium]|nr:hypothetical protein [Desulfobacterales bacterium]
MANGPRGGDALTVTSADDFTSQTIVVPLAGANNEQDANCDSGGDVTADEDNAFSTDNILANGRERDASDNSSASALVAGATLGRVTANGDGIDTHNPSGQFQHLIDGETPRSLSTAQSRSTKAEPAGERLASPSPVFGISTISRASRTLHPRIHRPPP